MPAPHTAPRGPRQRLFRGAGGTGGVLSTMGPRGSTSGARGGSNSWWRCVLLLRWGAGCCCDEGVGVGIEDLHEAQPVGGGCFRQLAPAATSG
jgi:hypothetical protein